MFLPKAFLLNSALVITALTGTVACGETDLLMPVEEAPASNEAVQIDAESSHEALTASFTVAPDLELKIQIRQAEDQLIQVNFGPDVLFKQRLDFNGAIKELQLGNMSVSVNEENEVKVSQIPSLRTQIEDCYDRRIRCYMDALEALSAIQRANPEAFANVNGENALIGFEALSEALKTAKPQSTVTRFGVEAPAKPTNLVSDSLLKLAGE